MSTQVTHQQEFKSDGQSDVISLVSTGSSGATATLQKEAGNSGNWEDVTDGVITDGGELTFWAPPSQNFRVSLTGNATAYVTI